MSSVWVVIYDPSPYEPCADVRGVFLTERLAKAHIATRHGPSDYFVEEWPINVGTGDTPAEYERRMERTAPAQKYAIRKLSPEEQAKMDEMRRDFHKSISDAIWGGR